MLYDIGSSGYILLITAIAFPLYFKIHVTQNAVWSDALWGALLASSSIVAGLVSPVVGAAADLSGRRLRYLGWATGISAASTIVLSLPALGVSLIALTFCISYVAYLVAAALYDSLLNPVMKPGSAGWISGLGWGLGYLGGLICYFLCSTLLGASVTTATSSTFTLTFAVVGAYYGVVSGVAIVRLRGVQQSSIARNGKRVLMSAILSVSKTARSWSLGGQVPLFIIGSYLMSGAASTLAVFTPILLASHFGLTVKEVAELSAIFSVLSIPATVGAGWLTTRTRPQHILMGLLPLWLLIAVLLSVGTGWTQGLVVALCLGLAIGPTNSVTRGIVASIINEADAAQMFGFAALVQRLSTAFGPLFFGILSSASSSRWPPVLMSCAVLAFGFACQRRHEI